MYEDDRDPEDDLDAEFDQEPEFSIADTVRSVAREVGDSIERMLEQVEFDDPSHSFGVDPDRAREWAESAGHWLRSRLESAGDELAHRLAGRAPEGRDQPDQDPLKGAAPSPLDLASKEQGLALAAIDSGRWTVEPGTETLASHGDGPGPKNALGLVRELRVRDWITADGQLTLAGRRALSRWLEASG
jgi:hypothetical protein